jgi:hypothetical protein
MGRVLFFSLCLYSPFTLSQGYYPLEVGNQWDYGEIDPQTPGQYHYLYSVRIIGDTTMSNGQTYSIEQSPFFGTRFFRQSGTRVYSFTADSESVLYDFALQTGDTAVVVRIDTFFTITTVSVDQGQIFGKVLRGWTYRTITNTSSDGGSVLAITDSIGRTYLFVDGGYSDYLMGAIINGTRYGTVTHTQSAIEAQPYEFRLLQNFPNPFNPLTTVEFIVPFRSEVELALYSSLGAEVFVVSRGVYDPGVHAVHIDGTNLASGVYFLRLVAPSVSIARPIVLIK